MKAILIQMLTKALQRLHAQEQLAADLDVGIQVNATKDKQHGDFSTNIALVLAKAARQKPTAVAQMICDSLPESDAVSKVEIAGPGFINFFMSHSAVTATLANIIAKAEDYGAQPRHAKAKIQVEFVSANPTGPLHVGHGRGAAYGASLANLLETAGYEVEREYYVNDAGRQMDILALSVWIRYLQAMGEDLALPAQAYQGDYVITIAKDLQQQLDNQLQVSSQALVNACPASMEADNPDAYLDSLIKFAKETLGSLLYERLFNAGLEAIRNDIEEDLAEFGVVFQHWFSEKSLAQANKTREVIQLLEASGHVYTKAGALWFRSTDFGDDKDRVIQRDNGQLTYFASDIAYHKDKFDRGFDRVINVWGADHHGYITRVKAALQALGYQPERLMVKLVQFATLYRNKERLQMSTRSGSFITLRTLRAEVGNDAARFLYVTRKPEQHMDFDLALAKAENKDNPVYYVQYGHARICSLIKRLAAEAMVWDKAMGLANLHLLTTAEEINLIYRLQHYPELLGQAARDYEPHQLAHYLHDLVSDFHSYYGAHRVKLADAQLRNARLTLYQATRRVIANGLAILGVNAPEHMLGQE